MGTSLTTAQKTNMSGFPKPSGLIEITGAHQLEATDPAIQNLFFQHAHDSGQMTQPDAEWEITFSSIRKTLTKHESNDRMRASLDKLMSIQVVVHYVSACGEPRTMKTHLLEFTDTDDRDGDNATVRFGIPSKLRTALASLTDGAASGAKSPTPWPRNTASPATSWHASASTFKIA